MSKEKRDRIEATIKERIGKWFVQSEVGGVLYPSIGIGPEVKKTGNQEVTISSKFKHQRGGIEIPESAVVDMHTPNAFDQILQEAKNRSVDGDLVAGERMRRDMPPPRPPFPPR